MSWVKIEPETTTHLKVREAGLEAMGLWLAGLCYCTRYRTDGRIDKNRIHHVWPWMSDGTLGVDQRQTLIGIARRLVAVGLWDEKDSHWRVHDFLDYQESRKEINLKRQAARDRQRNHRQRFLPKTTQTPQLPQHLASPEVTRDSHVSHKKKEAIVPRRVESSRIESDRIEIREEETILGGGGSGEVEGVEYPADAVDRIVARYEELARPLISALRRPSRLDEDHVAAALRLRGEQELLKYLQLSRDRVIKGDDKTWPVDNFRLEVLMRQGNVDRVLNANGANGNGKVKHREHVKGTWYPCGSPSCAETKDHEERP